MSVKELREKRAPLVLRMGELRDLVNDKKYDWTDENEQNWTKLNEDYNELTRQIDAGERTDGINSRLAELEKELKEPVGADRMIGRGDILPGDGRQLEHGKTPGEQAVEDRSLALQAWCLDIADKQGDITERHLEACKRTGIRHTAKTIEFPFMDARSLRSFHLAREQRAQSVITGSLGGILVESELMPSIEVALKQFGGTRQVSTVLRSAKGTMLTIPTSDDTGTLGERLGENASADTATDVTLGGVTFHDFKYSSKMIKVPFELFEDSAVALEPFIGDRVGERLGRKENLDFTTGTGQNGPKGITIGLTTGKTTAVAGTITADEVFDFVHSIDPAYRVAGAGFMFADTVLLHLRKKKTGSGDYLFNIGGLAGTEPSAVLGFPYTINQDMAAISGGNTTMIFGLLNKYHIRDIGSLRLKRFDERYGELDQIGFLGLMRTDGGMVDAGQNPVKAMVQQ